MCIIYFREILCFLVLPLILVLPPVSPDMFDTPPPVSPDMLHTQIQEEENVLQHPQWVEEDLFHAAQVQHVWSESSRSMGRSGSIHPSLWTLTISRSSIWHAHSIHTEWGEAGVLPSVREQPCNQVAHAPENRSSWVLLNMFSKSILPFTKNRPDATQARTVKARLAWWRKEGFTALWKDAVDMTKMKWRGKKKNRQARLLFGDVVILS